MSAGVAPAATEGSLDPAMSDPMQGSRPSRAELRRQREVAEEAAALVASPVTMPPASAESAPATRAERRVALEAAAAAVAAPSRAQLREIQRKKAKKRGPLRTLLTAWWVYPLVVLVAILVSLGVRSAQPPSTPPGIEVTTPTPIP